MRSNILSFIVDADIARSSGMTEHPVSSGSRKLLDSLAKNGHKAVMCPNLRREWSKHKSMYATRWLASMIARKKVIFIASKNKIKETIEERVEDCKEKEIALKDSHLIDAALQADKIIASNDSIARNVFCGLSVKVTEISNVSWFNAVSDGEFISEKLMCGSSIPSNYFLRSDNLI